MDKTQNGSDKGGLVCTQGLSAPVWDQSQTDPLPCARSLSFHSPGPFFLFKMFALKQG